MHVSVCLQSVGVTRHFAFEPQFEGVFIFIILINLLEEEM